MSGCATPGRRVVVESKYLFQGQPGWLLLMSFSLWMLRAFGKRVLRARGHQHGGCPGCHELQLSPGMLASFASGSPLLPLTVT